MRSWESLRGPIFGDRTESHHSLRHDQILTDVSEETVNAGAVATASDPPAPGSAKSRPTASSSFSATTRSFDSLGFQHPSSNP
jgi:hypothetical protein